MSRGAVYGLVGANGAGKTTLIKHVLGLLRAESGSVRVFGLDPVAVLSRLWLVSLDAAVLLAIHYEVSEPLLVAGLAPQLPLAYLVACSAVARARRGDVSDWRGAFARLGHDAPPCRLMTSGVGLERS